MEALLWLLVLALAVACAFVAATIAARKYRPPVVFFILGLATSVVGVVIVRLVPSRAPAGMRPVSCPRCNAVTNVPDDQLEFKCWQCKQQSPVPQPRPSSLALDQPRYKYAKIAMTVLLVATVAVFLTIQIREGIRRSEDAEDTILMICFGNENASSFSPSYSLGDKSRAAITTCEKKYDSFTGGPRWRKLKQNLDAYEKCMDEARALWTSGNHPAYSAKYDECISKR